MKYYTLIFSLLFILKVQGKNDQKLENKWSKYKFDYIVELSKINFEINDTIVPYTLIEEPYGGFLFKEGHLFSDDTINYEHAINFLSYKKGNDTLIPELAYIRNNDIVNLKDRLDAFTNDNGGILYTYNDDFRFFKYIKELQYTYVHEKLKLPRITELENDTIVRLTHLNIYPDLQPNIEVIQFVPFKEEINVEYTCVSIDSTHHFKTSINESVVIPRKKSKRLNSRIRNSLNENITYSTRTQLSEPYLIEMKIGGTQLIIERTSNIDDEYYSSFDGLMRDIEYYINEGIKK